jgi:transcriptional regulator GlxA family with amidase domain
MTLDVLIRAEHVRAPVGLEHGPVEVSAATWAAVSAMAEALAVDAPLAAPTQEVVQGLVGDGVVAPQLADETGAEAPSVERMWNALARHHDNWDTSIQLADLAEQAAMSSRQLSRDAQSLLDRVALDDVRFRDVVVAVRLRLATLLLSAGDATIAEVAQRVGYGSVDALGRALRDGGLPPPHAIRELVISPRSR